MRFIHGIFMSVVVFLSGCVSGEQRTVRPNDATWTDAQNSTSESCTQTAAPTFTKIMLNTKGVRDQGTAHLIMEASAATDDRLEYGLEGEGLEILRDMESPRAFGLSSMVPGREYTLKALAGDGCKVAVATIEVGTDIERDPSLLSQTTADGESYRELAWKDEVSMSRGI